MGVWQNSTTDIIIIIIMIMIIITIIKFGIEMQNCHQCPCINCNSRSLISFLMMGHNNIQGRESVTVYRVISFDKLSNDGA